MRYTAQEYTDMIICYGLARENSMAAERLYADRFPNRRHPTAQTILNCIQRTKETGSVTPKYSEGTVYRSLKNEEEVLRAYTDNPGFSIRQIARIVGVRRDTVYRIIRDEGQQQFEEMEDQDEVPLSIRLQFLKNNAKRRQGSPMKTRQKWKLKKDKNRIEIKNEIDKNQIDENQINENHIDENHIDENHIDENHIDENHTDENHTDENHIDENHIDENHIDENHIDENQIQIDEKLWLFEPEFIDCGS
ncbi:uncharacterized protein LOC105832958 isoform X2 [Monomorium pharaonis]|uniref:uncharacterized protein LOC105832958 isoform X2 n=1 Tax=Monomorium pharaonis TaxID=307658 RepID=UPI001745E4AE|nr:uncharacterized protein LOC105832958 isoform X2 [Monomorium pharaonis]